MLPLLLADPLFPGAGHASFGAATGVPFVAMAEAAYAPADAVTVGALAGLTPFVAGIGARPRVRFLQIDGWRVAATAPVLYYPSTDLGGAWILTRPDLSIEHTWANGASLGGGAGFVFADAVGERPAWYIFRSEKRWWGTLNLRGNLPLGKGFSAIVDAALIFDGTKLAPWIGGPPFSVAVGVGYVL
jgi:hypothetical protein